MPKRHLIKQTTVIGVYEISSSAEIPKKIEEIKKLVSKHPSTNQFIIVFK